MTNTSNVVLLRPLPFSNLTHKEYIVFATRTTGPDRTSEICEICMLDGHTGEIILDTLVKTHNGISPEATNIHGITQPMVADAPDWSDIELLLKAQARGKIGVAYNANFHVKMLLQSSQLTENRVDILFGFDSFFCAMIEYSKRIRLHDSYRTSYKWMKLSKAASIEGIEVNLAELQRARANAVLTHKLINKILSEPEYAL